jgi:hypothetical protein
MRGPHFQLRPTEEELAWVVELEEGHGMTRPAALRALLAAGARRLNLMGTAHAAGLRSGKTETTRRLLGEAAHAAGMRGVFTLDELIRKVAGET